MADTTKEQQECAVIGARYTGASEHSQALHAKEAATEYGAIGRALSLIGAPSEEQKEAMLTAYMAAPVCQKCIDQGTEVLLSDLFCGFCGLLRIEAVRACMASLVVGGK